MRVRRRRKSKYLSPFDTPNDFHEDLLLGRRSSHLSYNEHVWLVPSIAQGVRPGDHGMHEKFITNNDTLLVFCFDFNVKDGFTYLTVPL